MENEDRKEYFRGLSKTYGASQQYQFTGKRCSKNCKNLVNYETVHAKDCPFYEGSFSQKYDKLLEKVETVL